MEVVVVGLLVVVLGVAVVLVDVVVVGALVVVVEDVVVVVGARFVDILEEFSSAILSACERAEISCCMRIISFRNFLLTFELIASVLLLGSMITTRGVSLIFKFAIDFGTSLTFATISTGSIFLLSFSCC